MWLARYLVRDLEDDCERWAYCFQSLIFTLGIQATQRVEGLFSQLRARLSRASNLIEVLYAIQDITDRRYAQSSFESNQQDITRSIQSSDTGIQTAFKDILSMIQDNCSR